MPFSNYGELTEEIEDLIGRSDIRHKIPGWISLAEQETIRRTRDLFDIIFIETGNFVQDSENITLPTGTTSIESLQVDITPIHIMIPVTLRQLKYRQSRMQVSAQENPIYYTRISETLLEVDPVPASTAGYTIYYKKLPNVVTEASTTSQILAQAAECLLYGAVQHSGPYLRQAERTLEWKGLYRDAVGAYNIWLSRNHYKQIQVEPYGVLQTDRPQGGF